MSEYVEIKNKLNFKVSNNNNPVFLRVDCEYQTIVSVAFYTDKINSVDCGIEAKIGDAPEIRGKSIDFNGSPVNPNQGSIRIIHTIYQKGGDKLIYIFPDDFTGEPAFDENDDQPNYVFDVNFI